MSRGVRGVRLEGVKVGGTTYTSVEALQRFAERLSAHPLADGVAGTMGDSKRLAEVARRVERLLHGDARGGRRGPRGGWEPGPEALA
jgi:hypothetical protein